MWCVPRDPSRARKSFGLLCTLVLCIWTSSVRGAAKEVSLFSDVATSSNNTFNGCGPNGDGVWTLFNASDIVAPQRATSGQCVISSEPGVIFAEVTLGAWTYDILDIVLLADFNQQQELNAYIDQVSWLPLTTNYTLSELESESEWLGSKGYIPPLKINSVVNLTSLDEDRFVLLQNRSIPGTSLKIVARDQSSPMELCGLKVCLQQRNFGSDGAPITIDGVKLLDTWSIPPGQSLLPQANSKDVSVQDAGSRFCPGYPEGIPGYSGCPDGKRCTGVYTPLDCRSRCVRYGQPYVTKCQEGEVVVTTRTDCGINPFSSFGSSSFGCPAQPVCGLCTDCESAYVKAEVINSQYPSTPNDVFATSNVVSSQTTVRNAGYTTVMASVAFQFKSTQKTTMTLEKSTSDSTKYSLGLKVPIINAGLGLDTTNTKTLTNGETTDTATAVDLSLEYQIEVPPRTSQVVYGRIKTKTTIVKVPLDLKVYYTCDETREESNTALFTSNGVVTSGNTNIEIEYGPSQPYP